MNCEQRYPKQSAVLDAIGTPCILRPDLRTSFLTYYGRGVNTAIRRYEFGYVFKSPTNCGGDSSYQYSASVDNVWLQPCESSVVFMQRKSGSVVGTLCLWEAVLLSCQLLKTLSLLLHKSLHLRLNHVGVAAQIISTVLEQYGFMDIGSKKQAVEKLCGVQKYHVAFMSGRNGRRCLER